MGAGASRTNPARPREQLVVVALEQGRVPVEGRRHAVVSDAIAESVERKLRLRLHRSDYPGAFVAVVEGPNPGNDGSVGRSRDMRAEDARARRFSHPVRRDLGDQQSVRHVGIDGWEQRVDLQVLIGSVHDRDAVQVRRITDSAHDQDDGAERDNNQHAEGNAHDSHDSSDPHLKNRTPVDALRRNRLGQPSP
jgi:hypothetical protein